MIKFLIKKENKNQFQKIFQFLFSYGCELLITPEGLKYRSQSDKFEGIVFKEAFFEYPFETRRKLGKINTDRKYLKTWFNSWKELNGITIEIPLTI